VNVKSILKSSSFRTISIFAGGNFIAAAISGISGLLYAQWITPDVLGEFNKYGILTGYLGIGLVFVHGALPRQYPYLIGKGEKEEALKVAAAAKWWYLAFSWIGTFIFAILATKSIIEFNYRAALGWSAQIPALWMAIYGVYLQTLYRSANDFKKLSYNQLASTISAFFLLVLVKIWGYWGFVARFSIQGFIGLFVHEYYVPEKIKATFNLKQLLQLAKISIPLTIPSYLDTYVLSSSISFFILSYMGEKKLGLYSMALMLQGMLMIFTRAIHQVYITKITIKYGETEDILECIKYSKLPTLVSTGISIIIALVTNLLLSYVVTIMLPNYIETTPVLNILIWQLPLFASGMSLIVLSSALWIKELVFLRITKTAACIILISLLPKSLNWICYSILISDFIYYAGGYILLFYKLKVNSL
jgi:O-antigen/teichoic acid export membrane protein